MKNKEVNEKIPNGLEQLLVRLEPYPEEKEKFLKNGFDTLPRFMVGMFKNSCGEMARSSCWEGTHKDVAKIIRSVHALRWEVDCVTYAQKHNMNLHENGMFFRKKSVERPFYEKGRSHQEQPGIMRHKLVLQNDVPLVSDSGGMVVVEAKRAWFSPYGTPYGNKAGKKQHLNNSSLNQLLKYQMAMDEGWVESASIVVSGRILSTLWDWILKGPDGTGSLVPDVEVMWELPLPSGKEILVTVKKGKQSFYREDPSLSENDKAFLGRFEKMKYDPVALRDLLENRLTVLEVMEDYFRKKIEMNKKKNPMDCEVWAVSNVEVEGIFSKSIKEQAIQKVLDFEFKPVLKLKSAPSLR